MEIQLELSYAVNDEKTYKREVSAFDRIKDNYPKFLLILDYDKANINGIQKINVIDWLLEYKQPYSDLVYKIDPNNFNLKNGMKTVFFIEF